MDKLWLLCQFVSIKIIRKILCKQSGKAERVDKIRFNYSNSFPEKKVVSEAIFRLFPERDHHIGKTENHPHPAHPPHLNPHNIDCIANKNLRNYCKHKIDLVTTDFSDSSPADKKQLRKSV